MKSELVQIEVELILLKYGEPAVLKALSTATGISEDELRKKLHALQEKKAKSTRAPKVKKQPLDIATDVVKGSENEKELINLATLYQNEQFLPQLKDVKRFLGRFNVTKTLKSRNDATRLVFESLSKCTSEELKGFIENFDAGGNSSFATLADHIMGTHENKSSNN